MIFRSTSLQIENAAKGAKSDSLKYGEKEILSLTTSGAQGCQDYNNNLTDIRFLEDSSMHKQFKVPVKLLLIAAIAVLSFLTVSGLSLAETRESSSRDDRFEVVDANANSAYFSILDAGNCNDTDEHCTVKVTKVSTVELPTSLSTDERNWAEHFRIFCPIETTVQDGASEGNQNRAFEACWEAEPENYDVEWPIISLGRRYKFDITPHCDRKDEECAVELQICYNPADCNPADETGDDKNTYPSSRVARFWENAGDCLYDDDRDDVWDCIDEEFQDWLDDELSSSDDYNDFIGELEDRDSRLGIATDDDDDYDDDLDDVGSEDDSRDDSRDDDEDRTSAATYQRRWRTSRVTPIFEDEDEVDAGGYSFRPSRDDYLTIDFTSYLDFSESAQVCNTNVGCFNLVGSSSFFRQYLTSFYVQITNRTIVNCMDKQGYDVDDDHAISLSNPDLIFCDKRVAEAVHLCPRENIGADFVLYEMYSSGLLTGIVSDSAANSMRTSLESSRVVAPECLCAAGFNENQMVIAERESPDPWFSTTARRPTDVCD